MTTYQLRVWLKSGNIINGEVSDGENVTEEMIAEMRDMLTGLTSSSGGWQINTEVNGVWTTIPGSSIDFIQVVTKETGS